MPSTSSVTYHHDHLRPTPPPPPHTTFWNTTATTRPPPHDATSRRQMTHDRHHTTQMPNVTTRTKRPQRVESRANVTGHTGDGQGQDSKKEQQRGVQGTPAFFHSFFILLMSFQSTTHPLLPKHEKQAHLGAFFVSGTTTTYLTSHNTKHTKNAPVWVRSSCLGLPPPTPPPTSCWTHTGMSYMFVISHILQNT